MGEYSPVRPDSEVWDKAPVSFTYGLKYELPRPPENVKQVDVCLWCFPMALIGLHTAKNKEYLDRICTVHQNKLRRDYERTTGTRPK